MNKIEIVVIGSEKSLGKTAVTLLIADLLRDRGVDVDIDLTCTKEEELAARWNLKHLPDPLKTGNFKVSLRQKHAKRALDFIQQPIGE